MNFVTKGLKLLGLGQKREVGFFALLSSAALLLANLPTLLAAWMTPRGGYFLGYGLLLNRADVNSYVNKILQGMAGTLKFQSYYTTELQRGSYFNVFYLASGFVGRALTNNPMVIFQALRLTGSFFLLLGLWRLLGHFKLSLQQKSLGFGLLALLPSIFPWLGMQKELLEFNIFTILTYAPHFIVGAALLVWTIWCYLQSLSAKHKQPHYLLLALVLNLIQVFVYPFSVLLPLLAIGVHLVLLWVSSNQTLLQKLWLWLPVQAIPLMLGYGYYRLQQNNDSFTRAWLTQSRTSSQINIIFALLELGVLLPLVLLGLKKLWQQHAPLSPVSLFVAGWMATNLISLYLPINFAARLCLGAQIPFVLMAIIGLNTNTILTRSAKVTLIVIGMSLMGSLLYLKQGFNDSYQDQGLYLNAHETAVLKGLQQFPVGSKTVLALPPLGNYIPAVAGARTFVGQRDETLDFFAKTMATEHFLSSQNPTEQQSFLTTNRIDYVLVGINERKWLNGGVLQIPNWHLVEQSGDVELYGKN